MKKLIAVLLMSVATLGVANAQPAADYNVVPLPSSIVAGKGPAYELNSETGVYYTEGSDEMRRNAEFLCEYLSETTQLQLRPVAGKSKYGIRLVIDKRVKGDEAYTIEIDGKGVVVAGSTPRGVFYGVQTLRKALPAERAPRVLLPAVTIADSPRFVHRGMMLDCARHFFPVSFVKRFIDLLALHNMNVFHWHLTDDQGWRIEIKKYPLLTQIGSKRTGTVIGFNTALDDSIAYGGFYTQDEAREIVEYARQRYITVVPEIDMPGHMLAALTCYPDLGCTGGPYQVGHRWGIYRDVLCLGNEQTYSFCEGVLDEIMQLFPSRLIHIGGDEAPKTRWTECPKCQKVAADHNLKPETIQGYFTSRIEKFVNSRGRSIIGWDEILEGDVDPSATIMSWRNTEYGRKAAEQGHDVIMAPTSYCYFDYNQADAKNAKYEPTLCGGHVTVEKVYSFEPYAEGISEAAKQHILGVQANIWTEYLLYPNQVEYQMMPRMAALAEVQWVSAPKDYEAFRHRLDRLVKLYDAYNCNYAVHLWPERIVSPYVDN